MAFRIFCTPSLSCRRSADHDELVARARFHLRHATPVTVKTRAGDVVTHVVEPEGEARASIMIAHGWTSEASFMMAIAEYLRRKGYRVVLPDMPAHGLSPGYRTSLIDNAHAMREVAEALGPISVVIAHSMGGLAALLAGGGGRPMPRGYPFRAYALLSVPNRIKDVTRRFGRDQGLSMSAQVDFERRLERMASRSVQGFTAVDLLRDANRPALLLHATDDTEVPVSDAEAIVAGYPGASLVTFEGLGHRKILYAPPAVRAIGGFVERYAGSEAR